jgi:hypothetical protein
MTSDRIFWLEDNPNFFGDLPRLAERRGKTLDLPALLSNVTLAHDYAAGQAAVEASAFDLYILDADFRDRLSPGRHAEVEEFFRDAVAGTRKWHDFHFDGDFTGERHPGGVVGNNFARFYQTCIPGKRAVVLSNSLDAIYHARKLDLPFYTKCEIHSRFIQNWVENGNQRHGTSFGIEGWEHGCIGDLVVRYLV